jgi:hypothetical protein
MNISTGWHIMKLDSRAFGLAAASMAALLYVVCAAGVALVPGLLTSTAGVLIHVDVSGVSRSLTWLGFVEGLILWTLGTGLVFGGLAGVYNRYLLTDRSRAHVAAAIRA